MVIYILRAFVSALMVPAYLAALILLGVKASTRVWVGMSLVYAELSDENHKFTLPSYRTIRIDEDANS
jgi:hypothetical protein